MSTGLSPLKTHTGPCVPLHLCNEHLGACGSIRPARGTVPGRGDPLPLQACEHAVGPRALGEGEGESGCLGAGGGPL